MILAKELSVFNRITFVEKNHSYLVDGQPTNSPSVTRLLKKFKKEFDKDTAAARVAKRMRVSTKQVLADWELNNLYSTTIGSMLHKYIENFYCNKRVEFEGMFSDKLDFAKKKEIVENFPKLVNHFQNFYNENSHLICIKNEFVMGDIDDTKICGMADLLVYNDKENTIEILDFKTNKKIGHTKYGNLLYPFEDLCEGQINEYTIQLNTYQYFVEKYTNIKINKRKIIWINSNQENFKIFDLKDIQPKIKEMFNCYKKDFLFLEQ